MYFTKCFVGILQCQNTETTDYQGSESISLWSYSMIQVYSAEAAIINCLFFGLPIEVQK